MSPLNDNHHRHLLHGFLAIEERLAHLEALIGETETRSPLSAADQGSFADGMPGHSRPHRRIRSAMTAHLASLGIALEIRRKKLRWSVETSLIHLQTAIETWARVKWPVTALSIKTARPP